MRTRDMIEEYTPGPGWIGCGIAVLVGLAIAVAATLFVVAHFVVKFW